MKYYQGIADYYDLLMDGGYYDYGFLADAVQASIGPRKRILELGIGTGQLAKVLLEREPNYDFVGMDFSPAMLEIAKKRLPENVPLVECDIAEMKLDRRFDVAFSSGGTWVIVRSGDELLLGTHLFDREKDIQGWQNVAEHLETGGLLLLSTHLPHEDRDLELEDGIIYSQKISEQKGETDHFFVDKTYSFHRNGELLAEETLALGFYRENLFQQMLADVGFQPLGMTAEKEFFIYEKVA